MFVKNPKYAQEGKATPVESVTKLNVPQEVLFKPDPVVQSVPEGIEGANSVLTKAKCGYPGDVCGLYSPSLDALILIEHI